jgi:hypothetical protein
LFSACGEIEDTAEQQKQHRKWVVDRLRRMKKIFGPRLTLIAKNLPSQ